MVQQSVDPFYAKYGCRLRTARQKAGLSQVIASELLGITQPNLSRIELGMQAISLRNVVDMAKLYRVPIEHIVSNHSPLDLDNIE